jgi:hypothetical protein
MHSFRSIASIVLVATLAGCAAPAPALLGDTSRPLMAPGEGLVVGSVSFKTLEPDFKRYRLLYTASYIPSNEVKGLMSNYAFSIGNGSKESRSLDTARYPNETAPVLMLMPVKAGKYKLARVGVLGEGTTSFFPKDPREVEVIAGQVTYVGSDVIEYRTSYKGLGVLTPSVSAPLTRNDFARDMADLKTLDKRLESIPATNALVK